MEKNLKFMKYISKINIYLLNVQYQLKPLQNWDLYFGPFKFITFFPNYLDKFLFSIKLKISFAFSRVNDSNL